ncbi:MAG: peptide ABC transporter substrate-binding protein [Patescibacteria group bacterium]
MDLLKTKIRSLWQRVKALWPFFAFLKRMKSDQYKANKRLVYSLSPRKIPGREQIKHLNKFLNRREIIIVKICFLVVLVNLVYLGVVFLKNHLVYLPLPGGEYREGVIGYPKTINPLYAINRDVDADLSRLIYSSLFKYDENGRLVEDLVEKMEVGANGQEYLIKIKEGVKWHDGSSLTVDDVIFTFNLIKTPEYSSPLRSSFSVVEAEKVDEFSLKFILTEAYAPFPELLTFGILPKAFWGKIESNNAALSELNLKPVGSGPYKFKAFLKNKDGYLKEYQLVVNEDYYGGKPYIKNITLVFFVNYQEAIRALNDGKIMGLGGLPFESRGELLAQNSLRFNELARPRVFSLFFNAKNNKVLAEKDVRVALAQALNKDRIISDVFFGIYRREDGPILKHNFAYNEEIKKYEYSPAEAAETIKAKPLKTVLTVVDSGGNVAVAEKIKNYWEKAGVEISLKVINGEQAIELVKNRDFEIILYGESVGGDPDVYAFWHSSQAASQGLNLSAYSNSIVDTLLTEARVEVDPASRIAKYKKFQEIVAADLPAIFLYSPTYTYIQDKALRGFTGTAIIDPADHFSGVSNWYLKTKKKLIW